MTFQECEYTQPDKWDEEKERIMKRWEWCQIHCQPKP